MPGVPPQERELLVERQAGELFYFTDHYRNYPMVLIPAVEGKARRRRASARQAMADAGLKGGDPGI